MAKAEWYYLIGDQQFGPVSGSHLRELAAAGQLKPTDLVWRPGLPGWVPARKVRGIFPKPPSLPDKDRPSPSDSGVQAEKTLASELGEQNVSSSSPVALPGDGLSSGSAPPDPLASPAPEFSAPSVSSLRPEPLPTGERASAEPASVTALGPPPTWAEHPPEIQAPPAVITLPPELPEAQPTPAQTAQPAGRVERPTAIAAGSRSRPTESYFCRYIEEVLDAVSSAMPISFLGGVLLSAVAGAILARLAIRHGGAHALPLVLFFGWVHFALALAAIPAARMLAELNRTAPFVDCDPVPALWAVPTAGATWVFGLAGLVLATHLAFNLGAIIYLVGGFAVFVGAQTIALGILSFPSGLSRREVKLFGGEHRPDSCRAAGRLFGWLARLVARTSPTLAAMTAVMGCLFHANAAFRVLRGPGDAPGLLGEDFRLGDSAWLGGDAVVVAELTFATFQYVLGLALLLAGILIAFGGWALVPICRLAWERLSEE